MRLAAAAARAATCLSLLACASAEPRGPRHLSVATRARLADLSPPVLPRPPHDPTNRYLGDPRLVELGKRLFFDPSFSGPLLDEANNGLPGTLGKRGETGKVSCAGCHVPASGFLDSRSPRRQISLGAGWTRRRAPSLLDAGQLTHFMWDGRRDAAYSQPFSPIEDPFEFNSSRLFVAQAVTRSYRAEFEAIFGPLPSLAHLPVLAPEDAGCTELPPDAARRGCVRPGASDEAATRIVVNLGKAIQAYVRELHCGRSRFDSWMDGDASALDAEEQAGALLFVGKAGCDRCHSGPFFSDKRFHNVGLRADFRFFIGNFLDPGASAGLRDMLADPLNARGRFSDGYDARNEPFLDPSVLAGAFRTPNLRCVSRRPSFMHTGQLRSLEDVVAFFDRGGHKQGFSGTSELAPLGLTQAERAALVAFLRALDGDGPDPALVAAPPIASVPALAPTAVP